VLLDLMTPRVDGWEFLRQRRQDPALAAVPVVVLTAAGAERGREARSLGADEVLAKPCGCDALLDAVRRHCS
jgi:CheY-like chemotaxis protein